MSGFLLNMLGAAASAETADTGIVQDLVRQFGVDWPYFISQTINFLIVGAVLYFFAVKPLTKMLDQRRQKIEEGLRYADEMKTKAQAAEKERAELLKEASLQAQAVIQKAGEQGQALVQKQTAEAAAQAQALLDKARQQADLEHAQMLKDVRRQAAELVVQTTAAVLSRDLPEDERRRVSDEAARAIGDK